MLLYAGQNNLQGNTQTIQGGVVNLQGGDNPQQTANPQQAAPGVAPRGAAVTFYKPDKNNPTVYNAQGQALSYDQYIAQGGRPDFSNVLNTTIPGLQPTPAPQPAPRQTSAPPPRQTSAPVTAPAPMPAGPVFYKPDPNSQQVYNAQGQAVSYDQYIAQGGRPDFSNVVSGRAPTQQAAPSVPAAPAPAPASQPQTFALGDGRTYDASGNPMPKQGAQSVPTNPPALIPDQNPTQERIDKLSKQVFNVTAPNQQKIYEEAFNTAGLGTIRTRLTELNDKIAKIRDAYTAKEADINENPWLSEASRIGRSGRLARQRDAEIGNYLAEYEQLANLYNTGVDEVNAAVERQVGDFNSQRQISSEELNFLLGIDDKQYARAEKEKVTQRATELDAREFALQNGVTQPFYTIDGRTIIRSSDGKAYSNEEDWKADGGRPESVQQIAPSSPGLIELSEGTTLFDPTTGQAIYTAPKTYSPNSGGLSLGDLGLTSGQATQFNSIVAKYNASPLIAAADRTLILKETIERIKQDPGNAAQQLNLVYSYIQALDTYQSAVREGELALSSQVDSTYNRLKTNIEKIQSGKIISKDAALQIANAASGLVDTIQSGARQKAQSFQSQASVIGLGEAWNRYIGGFQQSYSPEQGGGSGGEPSGVDLNDLF